VELVVVAEPQQLEAEGDTAGVAAAEEVEVAQEMVLMVVTAVMVVMGIVF